MSKVIEIPDILIGEWEIIKKHVYTDPDFTNTRGLDSDVITLATLMAAYITVKMR